jgi:hypothetical protein
MDVSLKKLYPIMNIDGVKLAIDIILHSIFVWNDYAKPNSEWKGVKYVSCWVVFRYLDKITFFNFLKGEISLFELFIVEKYEYAFLKNDLDTIIIDKHFKFEITLPDMDSALNDEAIDFVSNALEFNNILKIL